MRTPSAADPDLATVIAARDGNRAALDALAAAYLPLVYNVVGRAMNGHPDVDDVVQETMLRAVRGLGELRDPASFRSWLVAIAIRQVRDSYRDRLARPPAVESDVPVPDFAEQTVERLGLTGQRRQAAAATRWLDPDDHPVLALWWQESAGEVSRAELATALGLTTPHAAVRVARMKERLAASRVLVYALDQAPSCEALAAITGGWDREPSPLWRKRLMRHVRGCTWCRSGADSMIPAERLLAGLPLLAVPAGLAGRALSRVSASHAVGAAAAHATGTAAAHPVGTAAVHATGTAAHPVGPAARAGARSVRHAGQVRHARLLAKGAFSVPPKLVAVSLAVVTCAAGGTFAVARVQHPAAAAAIPRVSVTAPPPGRPVPLVTESARLRPPASHPARTPSQAPQKTTPPSSPAAPPPPSVTLTSQRKGVGTWSFTGSEQALSESGASWYYNWAAAPNGIAAPATASFVPMIWGSASVTAANLAQVKQEGNVLLGFNEPDLGSQANMTVDQALTLWPQLMATGLTLGSPAVAAGAATPGGWLDQFMTGARARGYRVDFIALHWYGGDFDTGPAVQQLQSYLQAVYDRYHLPVWLTEFALTSYAGGTATFPAEAQQAAFLSAATTMLDGLPFLQRYAWFALPTSAGSGTTGLFSPGPSVTPVGQAFEAAR